MIALLVLGLQLVAAPDTTRDAHPNGIPVPRVRAVRASRSPVIDGRLDDEVWRQAPVTSGFTQSRPNEGAPAAEQTEVQVAYDENALYIGARMHEHDRSKIFQQLARRDQGDNGDLLIVAIDSYHDHLTAFGFALNPSGVKIDATASRDEENWDISWDAVWTGATHIDGGGWTAEMRIPLSQLRFSPRDAHVWGINFWRTRKLANENSALVVVKQSERGFASRFAHLVGISGIPTPRRLELMPYARGQGETRRAEPGDPFFGGRRASGGAGMDVKYGLTSNLTLDATINPDFGQVEADPAQLNLTAFEPFFQERRPFFVEGAQIFDFGVTCNDWCFFNSPSVFYSRRIGRSPSLDPRDPYDRLGVYASHDSLFFSDVPTRSTILGAAKLTGQLATGTSIGVLHAETGRVDGQVDATIQRTASAPWERVRYTEPVEPHSHYSVLRLRQSFNGGATTIGALGTSVVRDMSNDRLRAELPSRAFTAGVDARQRWSKNRFELAASLAATEVRGSSEAIAAIQTSSARYFQRPDQHHVRVDSSRSSLAGYIAQSAFSYRDLRGPYATVRGEAVSPGFESNDLGFLNSADYRYASLVFGWQRPKPGKRVRAQSVDFFGGNMETYGREVRDRFVGLGNSTAFQSGWRYSWWTARTGYTMDQAVSEGGPLVLRPRTSILSVFLGSDDRKRVAVQLYGDGRRNEVGQSQTAAGFYASLRPSTNVTVAVGPDWSDNQYDAILVHTMSDQAATATFGTRYVFGEVRRRSLSMSTRVDVTFTPNVTLQAYAQPFAAVADYDPLAFKALAAPGTRDFVRYGSGIRRSDQPVVTSAGATLCTPRTGSYCYAYDPDGPGGADPIFAFGTPDRTVRSFHGSAVLRWEYRPGATFYAVWTQQRERTMRVPEFSGASELPGLFDIEPQNVFLIKASYWLSR
jgi:uncharacterized protein DUF5916/cellulose/xylan binding protein with CBM9 domain